MRYIGKYVNSPNLQQLVGEVAWGQNLLIMCPDYAHKFPIKILSIFGSGELVENSK